MQITACKRQTTVLKMKIRYRARSCASYALGIREYPSRLDHELVDDLDEITVAVLIEIPCSEIHELVLRLHIVVDGDISFLRAMSYALGCNILFPVMCKADVLLM